MNTPHTPTALVGIAVAALLAGTLTALPPTASPAAAADPEPDRYLVSRTNTGQSTEPSLSSDGQHVAFVSTEALTGADTNGTRDVYLASAIPGSSDPFSGAAELVSRPTGTGATANGPSWQPIASADGRYVVFTSSATNLVVGGTTPGRRHVYLRDTVLETTTLVGPAGVEPNGDSFDPDMSDDGRWLVYTSGASNVFGGDTDDATDVVVADRDADGDGVFSTFTFATPTNGTSSDNGDASISGNGEWIIYRSTGIDPIEGRPPGGWLTKAPTADLGNEQLLFRYTVASAIDATGDVVVAATSAAMCGGYSVIAASWGNASAWHGVALEVGRYDTRVGTIDDVAVSSDGSQVAWTSTQPVFDTAVPAPVALSTPVVRIGEPSWWDAWSNDNVNVVACSTAIPTGLAEFGAGTDPSLSVSGRTVAFATSTPDLAPGATSAVLAVDRHTNQHGIAVSTVMDAVDPPSYMSAIDTANISPSTVKDYGAALANAPLHKTPLHKTPLHKTPLHKTPLHKTPLHKTPLHKTPLHKTPLHKTDVPGGWPELLIGTPFEGMSELTVTLGEVLDWAEGAADSVDPVERAAAARILELTLDDIDIDASGIGALSLGALVLGEAGLGQVPLRAGGSPVADWQAVVDVQGVHFTVAAGTALAELDFAGVDVGLSGVDRIPLRSLPVDATNLTEFLIDDLELAGTVLGALRTDELTDPGAIVADGFTGTLSEAVQAHAVPGKTAADLARVAPDWVTFGDLLAALLDRASYPWEQISAASLDASRAETISTWQCGNPNCSHFVDFRYSFDPGPGEDVVFPQAMASISMPDGTKASTVRRDGAGPGYGEVQTDAGLDAGQYTTYRSLMTMPLGDTRAGTVVGIEASYTITSLPGDGSTTGTLTVGDHSVSHALYYSLALSGYDTTDRNRNADGSWVSETRTTLKEGYVYYEWISPEYRELDDFGKIVQGSALDEDWYIVPPPSENQRMVVSTNATDGQLAIGLYREASGVSGLGTPSGGDAPGTGTTEQAIGTSGAPATSGTDTGQDVAGHVLVDQASMSGMGSASVEATGAEAGDSTMLLRVTSGNGSPSAALYSLRVQYIDEPSGPRCAPWAPAQTADPGVVGTSDPIGGDTNTVYLVDTQRYGDTWGAQAAADVRAELATLDGVNGVNGAVISIDESDDVRVARAALDDDPCSMTARAALTKQINRYVDDVLGSHKSHISSLVIVGGDDIIPLAPIAEHIDQFTEVPHAADLRRDTQPDGSACPGSVAEGAIDPCATPLQAAAATSHILSDDPYGLATAYDTVGGTLYVPSTATGRLVEDPAQITATIARFRVAQGVLQASSTLTGGYGAWAELPGLVAANLDWRTTADTSLGDSWDRIAVGDNLFPGAGKTAGVVSLNAHFDEKAMLPGVPNASDNRYTPEQLFRAASVTDTQAISDSLIFTIGCHAGSNLPASYYGAEATDWVDVFSDAAGYIANTGYGLANDTQTALSERLLALYADWLGVTTDDGALSTGGSLVQAKRAYLAQLGMYGGYDEKVLMQAVYYGLPMYTLESVEPPKNAPLPEVPASLEDARSLGGSLLGAGLSLQPTFTQAPGGNGTTVVVVNGDENAQTILPGEPVLPKLTYQLDQAPAGTKARGAIIRSLTSSISDLVTPLIADVSGGVAAADGTTRSDIAFPSTFAHVTTQETPDGVRDLLVLTPARVQARVGGTGTFELFTDLDVDILYGPASSDDEVAPAFTSSGMREAGARRTLEATVNGTGSDVMSVLALVQEKGATEWTPFTMLHDSKGWYLDIPLTGEIRWFLQAVDAAGNVGIDTGRGHLDAWGAEAPQLSDLGADASIATGERIVRSVEVTDATLDDRLTATYVVSAADGSVVATGMAPVGPGADGVTRTTLDARVDQPGTHTVTLTVCRAGACTSDSFGLVVVAPNHAPTASVAVTSSTTDVGVTSVLTAHATAADEDGDVVTIAYRWLRNGVPIPDAVSTRLDLADLAQVGDEIMVEAVASDGSLVSGAARASVFVAKTPDPPHIAATATNALGAYASGSWSRSAVTVSFTCTSGVAVITCPAAQIVSADTTDGIVTVSGTMRDILGREATATFQVRVDKTPPVLAPTVTPNPVQVGATATATPNATDAASGILSQSCATPGTTTPGDFMLPCTATDVAGNTATATVQYTVTAPASSCLRGEDRTIMPPVNADGTSVFLRLSAVPVVFKACDTAGKPIGTSGFVKSVTQISTASLPSSAKVTELPFLLPTVKPIYVKLTGTWVGAIGSLSLAGGKKYTYRVTLADGTSFTFAFGVK